MTGSRVRLFAIAVLMFLVVAHASIFGWWLVDDAAISFAYARSWANGLGLVPFPGGERIEGYSNFTWVALLALGEGLGIDAFWGAKVLSMFLAAATVPVVARLGARMVPLHPDAGAVAAAALYVTHAQTGIFTAAGLENPLFSLLLALGLLWGVEEADQIHLGQGAFPKSAVAWLLLALTRPEGIVYAAGAGAWALWAAIGGPSRRVGARWIAMWLTLFFVPFLSYHAVRYAYFAWPFPMTYYAKVQAGPRVLVDWRSSGWVYLRGYWDSASQGTFLPALVIGAIGLDTRARALRVVGLVGLGALMALTPSSWFGSPDWLFAVRPAGLWATAALVLGAAVRRAPGLRGACWTALLTSLLFSVHALGDWMGGFRWLALASVPLSVLLAGGLIDLAHATGWTPLWRAGVVAAVSGFAVANGQVSWEFRRNPEIRPETVRARYELIRSHAERLQIDERIRVFTYDMGGFLWWSDMEVLDAMGLVDVAIAVHKPRLNDVYETYLYEEKRPHFIAIPKPLADQMRKRPRFEEEYVAMGVDMAVRRDLLFEPAWSGPAAPAIGFGDLGSVVGSDLPAPAIAPGDPALIEVGLSVSPVAGLKGRLVLSDATGTRRASWPADLGYGWIPPERWAPGEVFHGRYPVALPTDLEEGDYTVGLQLLRDGRPVPVDTGDDVAWLGRVVVSREAALQAAESARGESLRLGAVDDCPGAKHAWFQARQHRPNDVAYAQAHAAEVARAQALCWLRRAASEPEQAERWLVAARRSDPTTPELAERLRAAADARFHEGESARARGAWSDSLAAFTAVLDLEPTRAWARRYAEEARTAGLPPRERR